MRGRIPAPKSLRIVSGNRHIHKNPLPGSPSPSTMRCPSWMPQHGKELWRKFAQPLINLGILTELDRPGFEALCMNYSTMRQAAETLAADGLTVKDARRATVKHPVFTIYKTAQAEFKKLAEHFGMTPLSRQRIDIAPVDFDDGVEDGM